ncbi:hypothetical protein Poli38472_011869 [Pythium oligandrum]|uniref:Uncharacterized protein n=1 Tax=Pythium oligandrum TaxID=41045 RepID=A0A8K1C7V4_PYTOL|nr:hypothetical protein Poli38472_011869 [Pythium oligandrum]|eukprot:TMW58281.1 hypothetical protein Poli38472_011869 [Pythium oligandrum]
MSEEAFWTEFATIFGEKELDLSDALAFADEFVFADWKVDPLTPQPIQPEDLCITPSTQDSTLTPREQTDVSSIEPTRRWATRREELNYLRAAAQELESRLAVLRDPISQLYRCSSTEVEKVWASIAARQLHALHRSMRENARLRVMVQSQLRNIRSIERVVTKTSPDDIPSWDITPEPLDPVSCLIEDQKMNDDAFNMLDDFERILSDPCFLLQNQDIYAVQMTADVDMEARYSPF